MGQTVVISTALSEQIRKLYFQIVPEKVRMQHRFASWDEMISLLFEHINVREQEREAYLDALITEVNRYLNNPAYHDACMNSGLINSMCKNTIEKIKKDFFGGKAFDISKPESKVSSDKPESQG